MASATYTILVKQSTGSENVRVEVDARSFTLTNNTKHDHIFNLSSAATLKVVWDRNSTETTITTPQGCVVVVDPDNAWSDNEASPEAEYRVQVTYADAAHANPDTTAWMVVRREAPLIVPATAYSASSGGTALLLEKVEVSYRGASSLKGRIWIPG